MATPENPNQNGDAPSESNGETGRVVSIPGANRTVPPGFVPNAKPGGPGSRGPYKPRQAKTETHATPRQNDSDLDPAVIGELFVSLSEITDDLFVLAILSKARSKLTPEIFPKFKEEMERVRLGEKDKNLIRTGAIALAKKYTFLLHWGPEVILIVCAVQYTARMGNCFRQINSLPNLPPAVKPGEASPAPA